MRRTLLLMLLSAAAVAADTSWVYRFDGSVGGDDGFNAVDVRAGRVFASGFTWSDSTGFDALSVLLDESGNVLRRAVYSGPGKTDSAVSVVALAGGGALVGAWTQGDRYDWDIAVVKYDTALVERWTARYSSPSRGADQLMGFAVDDKGRAVVCGTVWGGKTRVDIGTVKFKKTGKRAWARVYDSGNANWDKAGGLAVSGDATYVVGSSAGGTQGFDAVLLKLDKRGKVKWVVKFDAGDGKDDFGDAVVADADGRPTIAVRGTGKGGSSVLVVLSYDDGGVLRWKEAVPCDNRSRALLAVSKAGVTVAARAADGSLLVNSYDSDGARLWTYEAEAATPVALARTDTSVVVLADAGGSGRFVTLNAKGEAVAADTLSVEGVEFHPTAMSADGAFVVGYGKGTSSKNDGYVIRR